MYHFFYKENETYQVITKEILSFFALPNQMILKNFTGMRIESCIFGNFSALQGCGTMAGKNRESSGSQATRTEVEPFPLLTKPWTTTSWIFC